MDLKGNVKWVGVALVALVLFGVWQVPDDKLHLYFCDVGQGDAELVVKGKVQILIDGGPNEEAVLQCLAENMPFWDREIELIINSHPHKDHLAGLVAVLNHYEIDKIAMNEVLSTEKTYLKFILEAGEKGIEIYQPQVGDEIRIGDLSLKILAPSQKVLGATTDEMSLNEVSLVIEMNYQGFNVLFTGDISSEAELALVGEGVIKPVEVLKVAHHGSKYSSGSEFLAKLRPKLGIIEVGAKNSFGHPNGEALKRFDAVGTKILRTDQEGTIEVVSDGEKWWVK